MDPAITSALIGAAATTAASASSNIAAGKLNKKSVKYNKELADYNFNINKQMADYQYNLNSVKNQVQQYIDAGLNPHLAYGNTSPSSFQSPVMNQLPANLLPSDFNNIGNAVNGFFQNYAQFQNTQNQTDLTASEIALKDWQKRLLEEQTFNTSKNNTILDKTINTFDKFQHYQLETIQNNVKKQNLELQETQQMIPLRIEQAQQSIKSIIANRNLTNEQYYQMLNYKRKLNDLAVKIQKFNVDYMLPLQFNHTLEQIKGLEQNNSINKWNFERLQNTSTNDTFKLITNYIKEGAGAFKNIGDAISSFKPSLFKKSDSYVKEFKYDNDGFKTHEFYTPY
ncbi:minor capsid protein [Capybara microvirus Cap3_SP_475]|nr:minor capsid protein [Capybara microvirus Cap3_SP_475]